MTQEDVGGNVLPFQRKNQPEISSAKQTLTTLSRSNALGRGLIEKNLHQNLISNMSRAMGLLATLSLGHPSLWINKLQTTEPEHLRILLLEVMEEIYLSQTLLTTPGL